MIDFFHRHREPVTNFIWRISQLLMKDGINFLIFLVAAKLLVPYEFGIYNYVMALVFFFILFGDFGISVAASKFVAEFDATDKDQISYVLFNCALIILLFSTAFCLALFLVGPRLLKDQFPYIVCMMPTMFLAPLTSLYDGIYRGLMQFKKLSVISMVTGLISLAPIYFLIKSYGLWGTLIAQNLYYFLLLIGLSLFYKGSRFVLNWRILRSIGMYALIIGTIHVSAFLYTRVDTLVLGSFGYINEINYYEIVNKFLMLMTIPFLVAAQIKAPNIVALYSSENRPLVLHKMNKYMQWVSLFSALAILATYLAAPIILERFFPEYLSPSMIIITNIFLALFLFQSVANYVGNTFIVSTGHAKINMINILIFGLLNLILDIFLVDKIGYMGIAYAKIIVVIPASISLLIFYRRALKKHLSRIGPGPKKPQIP
jgi:O-antigen/teichoic acid export membrane protein